MPNNNPANADDTTLQTTLRDALHDELAHTNPEAGLAQLHARLRADAAHAPPPTPPHVRWRRAVGHWFTQWPTAIASLVIVLQAGLLAWQAPPQQEDGVAWRSVGVDELRAPTLLFAVRFNPQATVQAVQALLASLGASAVGGPDADDTWLIALPAASVPAKQQEQALAALRASAVVRTATAPLEKPGH